MLFSQRQSYNFEEIPALSTHLKTFHCLDEESLTEMSLKAEPRYANCPSVPLASISRPSPSLDGVDIKATVSLCHVRNHVFEPTWIRTWSAKHVDSHMARTDISESWFVWCGQTGIVIDKQRLILVFLCLGNPRHRIEISHIIFSVENSSTTSDWHIMDTPSLSLLVPVFWQRAGTVIWPSCNESVILYMCKMHRPFVDSCRRVAVCTLRSYYCAHW